MMVVVCGDRYWANEQAIRLRLQALPPGTTVIEGGARGADAIAAKVARELGFIVIEVKAEWDKYGRAAGPIRNRKMLDLKPDLVIAFHGDLSRSRGTADTVREAQRRGIPTEVITGFPKTPPSVMAVKLDEKGFAWAFVAGPINDWLLLGKSDHPIVCVFIKHWNTGAMLHQGDVDAVNRVWNETSGSYEPSQCPEPSPRWWVDITRN